MARSDELQGQTGVVRRRWWPVALLAVVLFVFCMLLVGPPADIGFHNVKPQLAQTDMRSLGEALDVLRDDIGRYPTEAEGLALLLTPPEGGATPQHWHGPYIRSQKLPRDPWRQDYHYSAVGAEPRSFTLYSGGEPGGLPGEPIRYSPAD